MTTLVLVLLGGIWAVVLTHHFIRSRTDGSLGDSIGTFSRHLSVLERAAPTSVNPANRLKLPVTPVAIPPYRPPTASGSGRGRQSAFAPSSTRRPSAPQFSSAAQRRRQAQKRRRDVLFALLAGMAGSLLLSMVHGLGVMLAVHVILDLLFLGYIALLVRMRSLSAEREMKLTFLPAGPQARMSGSRPAAKVAYARAVGYGDGAEYGLPSGY